jgi:hypothetical protein
MVLHYNVSTGRPPNARPTKRVKTEPLNRPSVCRYHRFDVTRVEMASPSVYDTIRYPWVLLRY